MITALVIAMILADNSPTIRFYDKSGRSTGSATTYSGGTTKYYDERGNLVGGSYNGSKQRERR